MSLTVQQPIGGQLLSGVKSCYILVNESEILQNPRVIMLIGEIHGKQTCGKSDYVTEYLSFLHYNETTTQEPIDILIEMGNYNVTMDHGSKRWIDDLRETFQDCYVFTNRDTNKCFFQHARFHWSDPLYNNPQWLMDVEKLPPFIHSMDEISESISKEIKSEDDLQKIIFENLHILKQGERCTIEGWRNFISEQFKIIYTRRKEKSEALSGSNGTFWWNCGMFEAQRFSVDAYAFLRMFRKKESQEDRWITANRFKNIIYHAGQLHIDDMKQMLLNLNTKTAKFRVESETHAYDAAYHAKTVAYNNMVHAEDVIKAAAAAAAAVAAAAAAAAPADFAAARDTYIAAAVAYDAARDTYADADAAYDAATAARDTICCRVDFREFLQIIQDKKAVLNVRDTKQATKETYKPPFYLLEPRPHSTFLVRQKTKGGSNSKLRRINPKTRRTKPKTRRVKHKTRRTKLKTRRRRYHKYKIFRIL
jgi:hypothetical protein